MSTRLSSSGLRRLADHLDALAAAPAPSAVDSVTVTVASDLRSAQYETTPKNGGREATPEDVYDGGPVFAFTGTVDAEQLLPLDEAGGADPMDIDPDRLCVVLVSSADERAEMEGDA